MKDTSRQRELSRRRYLAAALLQPVVSAMAQTEASFPNRIVRVLVPAATGGVQDVRSRQIAEKLADAWRQAVVVDNRPGAGGVIAMDVLLRAPADGYTIGMFNVGTLAQLPHLMKVNYDPLADVAAVTLVSSGPLMLLAHPGSPYDSVAALVRLAMEKPGHIAIGAQGATQPSLIVALLNREAGIALNSIPYPGGAKQVTDLIGGQIPLLFDFAGAVEPHIRSGRIRALAVAGQRRLALLPEVPTFAELGYSNMVYTGWQGIVAKSGTPKSTIDGLHKAVSRALQAPDVREAFAVAGAEVGTDGPEAFGAYIRTEHARWGKLIAEAGIKVQ